MLCTRHKLTWPSLRCGQWKARAPAYSHVHAAMGHGCCPTPHEALATPPLPPSFLLPSTPPRRCALHSLIMYRLRPTNSEPFVVRPADILLKAWDGRRDLAVDLTIVHPNPVTGRPLRGSAATFLKDKGEQKCRKSAESSGRMGVDFSPTVFDTWRGLHGAGNEVIKKVFARFTAPLLPSARPAAVGALRQGLSVQLGRSVARQLEALMIVSTDTPAWWAAALPLTPAFTAAGNPQW